MTMNKKYVNIYNANCPSKVGHTTIIKNVKNENIFIMVFE